MTTAKPAPPGRASRHGSDPENAAAFESRLWRAGHAIAVARARALRLRALVLATPDEHPAEPAQAD
jgi:hypothetical protein